MAVLHKGATEEGRGLLAFFFGNALVEEDGVVNGLPNMKEVGPINYQEELTMIRKNLSESGREIRFVSSPAIYREIEDRLNKGCQMLHFTGHGCKEGLGFEADEAKRCGVLEPLTVDKLRKLFNAADQIKAGRPELVFFGSCSSEAHGNALAEAGVPHVIAVRSGKKVEDETARIFSSAFYHALIAGNYTVKEAFDNAVTAVNAVKNRAFDADVGAVANEDSTTAEVFLLLPENCDHDVRIFDDLPKGTFKDETPRLPMAHRLPLARKTYFGAVGLQHAIGLLEDPDAACVSIVGEAEIGKTERALQAAHYVRERNIFNAIFYAEFKQVVSQRHSPPIKGSRYEVERFYKRRFCELIAMALGWNPESNTSAEQLWCSMLQCAMNEMESLPFNTLFILDGVDSLYEDCEEARTSLVKVVNDLCRMSPNLKLLLTCNDQLLKGTDERLSNTKELVHTVLPLQRRDSALLLWHLSPRDGGCGLCFEDIDAKEVCLYDDVVERIQKLPLMETVDGHPGTLCYLGPLLLSCSMKDHSMVEYAKRYRVQLSRRREPFSEIRANDIASKAGLKDSWCKLVWVGATARAEAEGRRVNNPQDDAHYRFVLWRYLALGLGNWLCHLQTIGDSEEQLEDNNPTMWNEGSGRTLSSGSCFNSGAGWGARDQDLGHGYNSTQKPRKPSKEELKFVRNVLWSCKPRKISHRSSFVTQNKERGHRNGAGGVDQKGKAEEKGRMRCVSEDFDEVVTLEKFVNFCNRWWIPVMTTLSRIRKEWTAINPMKIRGFVSRLEAERLLGSTGQSGVFLLRFSEAYPGRLILTFTSEAMNSNAGTFIQHSLVTVQPDGQWTLHYGSNARHDITYTSLRDFVLDKGILRTLYPRHEKKRAFET